MFQELSSFNYRCEDCELLLYGSPADTYFKEHTSVCNHGFIRETGKNNTKITYFKNPALKMMDYSKVSHSGSEIKIYKYLLESDKLHKNGEFDKSELRSQLKIPRSTLTRSLESMVRKGAIVKLRHGRYWLPPNNESGIDRICEIAIEEGKRRMQN